MTKNNLEHQLDRYAMITSATHEIERHLDNIDNDSPEMVAFHMAHIQKAAQKIRFIEEICIIRGSEYFVQSELMALWRIVEDGSDIWCFGKFLHLGDGIKLYHEDWINTAQRIVETVKKHQAQYKELPTLTAPF